MGVEPGLVEDEGTAALTSCLQFKFSESDILTSHGPNCHNDST